GGVGGRQRERGGAEKRQLRERVGREARARPVGLDQQDRARHREHEGLGQQRHKLVQRHVGSTSCRKGAKRARGIAGTGHPPFRRTASRLVVFAAGIYYSFDTATWASRFSTETCITSRNGLGHTPRARTASASAARKVISRAPTSVSAATRGLPTSPKITRRYIHRL